jgi:hypothetical protein
MDLGNIAHATAMVASCVHAPYRTRERTHHHQRSRRRAAERTWSTRDTRGENGEGSPPNTNMNARRQSPRPSSARRAHRPPGRPRHEHTPERANGPTPMCSIRVTHQTKNSTRCSHSRRPPPHGQCAKVRTGAGENDVSRIAFPRHVCSDSSSSRPKRPTGGGAHERGKVLKGTRRACGRSASPPESAERESKQRPLRGLRRLELGWPRQHGEETGERQRGEA